MSTQALIRTRTRPDAKLEAVKRLVLNSLSSENSRLAYGFALDRFTAWYVTEWRDAFNKACVNAYRTKLQSDGLKPSSVNARLAAIRAMAREAADNNYLPYDVAAAICRVKRVRSAGTITGFWLTKEQAESLLAVPDRSTLIGIRDYAILAVAIGCGLRREELCHLTFDHLQKREGRWCVVDLIGKGSHVRTVPMASWIKESIDAWALASGIGQTGIVFRAARGIQRREAGLPLIPQLIWKMIGNHARTIGLKVRPHDCRRSFAKLAHRGGSPVEQVQRSLGHSSIRTTEVYLGINQDLVDAPTDRLGLTPPPDTSGGPNINPPPCAPNRAEPTSGTLTAYARYWREFESWAAAKDLPALPAVPETVVLYLADHSHLKRGALDVRLTAITRAHRAAGYPSPASRRHPAIAEAWKAATHTAG